MQESREVEDEEVDNLNHLIFNKEELEEYKKVRFSERKS